MIHYDLVEEGVWEEVLRIAAGRHKGKENLSSTRKYTSGNPNIIGCAGEMAFELATGYDMDREIYMGGDGGFDFVLPAGTHSDRDTRVDVKTRSTPLDHTGDTTFWLKDKDLTKDCELFVFCLMARTRSYQPLPFVRIAAVIPQSTVKEVAKGHTKGYDVSWLVKLSQCAPIEELFTLDNDKIVHWT